MFFTEEDVLPAIALAEKLFGKNNSYILTAERQVLRNVSVATEEFGKLWYGDLVWDDNLQKNINLLSNSLNQNVYVMDGYEFDRPYLKNTNRIKKE